MAHDFSLSFGRRFLLWVSLLIYSAGCAFCFVLSQEREIAGKISDAWIFKTVAVIYGCLILWSMLVLIHSHFYRISISDDGITERGLFGKRHVPLKAVKVIRIYRISTIYLTRIIVDADNTRFRFSRESLTPDPLPVIREIFASRSEVEIVDELHMHK